MTVISLNKELGLLSQSAIQHFLLLFKCSIFHLYGDEYGNNDIQNIIEQKYAKYNKTSHMPLCENGRCYWD